MNAQTKRARPGNNPSLALTSVPTQINMKASS